MESTGETTDESAANLPMLESEVRRLRELLAQVKSNAERLRQEVDELLRDRDEWQRLAERAVPEHRAWFCGRAFPGN